MPKLETADDDRDVNVYRNRYRVLNVTFIVNEVTNVLQVIVVI